MRYVEFDFDERDAIGSRVAAALAPALAGARTACTISIGEGIYDALCACITAEQCERLSAVLLRAAAAKRARDEEAKLNKVQP
jgi:hypothetical protein